MQTIDLAEKLALVAAHWDPKVVARYNGNDVMVVKFAGEFPFHVHEDSDDFFLVLAGEVTIDRADGESVALGPGQLCVVPAGVTHRPRAESETHVLLIEPSGLPNTGDPATAAAKEWI